MAEKVDRKSGYGRTEQRCDAHTQAVQPEIARALVAGRKGADQVLHCDHVKNIKRTDQRSRQV